MPSYTRGARLKLEKFTCPLVMASISSGRTSRNFKSHNVFYYLSLRRTGEYLLEFSIPADSVTVPECIYKYKPVLQLLGK